MLLEFGNYRLTVLQLLIAAGIYMGTKVLLFFIRRIIARRLKEKTSDRGKAHALFQLFRYFIWVIVILIILDTVGITLTYLLAGSAALFVGIGLGLQDVFRDIAAGVLLLVENNVRLNDVIEVQNVVGRVEYIGLRTSVVYTRDGIRMIIPNSKFISDNVINWTKDSKATRFRVKVGVAYGSDEKLVRKLLIDCALEQDILRQEKEFAPFVRLVDFGDSSLDFELYFWTFNVFPVENTKSEIRFAILESFRDNNIVIPFPQRDLHIVSDQAGRINK